MSSNHSRVPASDSVLESIAEHNATRAARLRAEWNEDPYWADGRFTTCRVCGFAAAESAYHRQTCSVHEHCPRCGASCTYSLEAEFPDFLEARRNSDDLAEFLEAHSTETLTCPSCGGSAYAILNVEYDAYEIIAYCPGCDADVRSSRRPLEPDQPHQTA